MAESPTLSAVIPIGPESGESLERIAFRTDETSPFTIPLRHLAGAEFEEWSGSCARRRGAAGSITFVETGDAILGTMRREATADVEAATLDAYREMLAFVRGAGQPHFLRIWNHLADINETEDGLERYRRFSVGRHEAFREAGYRFENDLPAASAVGSHDDALTIYFVASHRKPVAIENRRQVSAFAYPPQYGPKSPSFSRASIVDWGSRSQLFLSGTASIVGHESVHIGDVGKQLDETFRNIDELLDRASSATSKSFTRETMTSMKVYVRNPEDAPGIESLIKAMLPALPVIYVEADICRKELLLEIEAIAVTR